MRTFIEENFTRLSLFMDSCEHYHATLPEKAAVLCSYNGVFVYVFMLVIAVYDRSIFHSLASLSVAITSLGVSILEDYVPEVRNSYAWCSDRATDTPSTDMAIVACIVIFYLVFDLYYGSRRIWVSLLRFSCFALLYLTTAGAFLYLLLYDLREIVMSSLAGALVGALMATLTTLVIIPNLDNPVMGKLCSMMMVEKYRVR